MRKIARNCCYSGVPPIEKRATQGERRCQTRRTTASSFDHASANCKGEITCGGGDPRTRCARQTVGELTSLRSWYARGNPADVRRVI